MTSASAPGRVNLIGEWTDVNGGLVLPFAIGLATTVEATPRADDTVTVTSTLPGAAAVRTTVADLRPGRHAGWSTYPLGVAWALGVERGVDLHVDGRVPPGAGLSSSAALSCATALALDAALDLGRRRDELVDAAVRAERVVAGVPCGTMDQTVAMWARPATALLVDTATGSRRHVPFDPAAAGLAVLVIDTGARHQLADGGYAGRRAECAEAARALGVDHLSAAVALGALADRPALLARARHVLSENDRVRASAAALDGGDLRALGPILSASHVSLRDDFAVSCPPLDDAVDAAMGAGALGARLVGAGFGGSVVALLDAARRPAVIDAVAAAAARGGHSPPKLYDVRPSGAAVLE